MKISTLAATLALVATPLLAGCGSDKSSSSTGASPGGTTAAAAGGKAGIVATCVKKTACTEYRNSVPDLSEDLCTGTDGAFKKGATPCPTEKLLGTCVNKLTPDSTTYWYGGAEEADLNKGLCEALEGKWTPAPSKAAAGGSGAAAAGTAAAPGAAPATPAKAPAATPAKAPAAPAKAPAKKK